MVVLRGKQMAMMVLQKGAIDSIDESTVHEDETAQEECHEGEVEEEYAEYIRYLKGKYEVPRSFVIEI